MSDDREEFPGRNDTVTRPPGRWAAFKASPFLPATVLLFILSAAAGLFAGSYTYVMADPTPHHIPAAVVGAARDTPRAAAFTEGMEKALNASLELRAYDSYAHARVDVDEQRVFAVLRERGDAGRLTGVDLEVVGAAGAAVAQVLAETAPRVGQEVGVPVAVKDIKPLQRGDPRGLALFYISLAAVIIGFIGAIQLSVHAGRLNPAERIAFILAYAVLGGFSIAAVADWGLGALDLPFGESWMILSLTMFTSGMVFTMFNTLIGRWAMLPTWGLMVLLGNPSSGGAVSWQMLPSLLGHIGRWLPPGASVNAQHTAVYFGGHQHAFPFLVLTGWAVLSAAVFLIWRHRHPGGRERVAAAAS
ncbi:ABC transporter permease [Streptomyces sp. ISL-11]|uniref:ABC transporter permease n=1 Tax=Streptomyces sp. ISL-11 TaxID=2819174 RepID=UPI001BE84DA3|nr:ABC transporter permease [Streptomyces sp. ISL-11]MBT2385392.1 ABC transporter permease [Streptomyces sp. ISL-11]